MGLILDAKGVGSELAVALSGRLLGDSIFGRLSMLMQC